MSTIETVEKSLRDKLNADHKAKHATFAIINGLIAFIKDVGDGSSAYKAGIERFAKVVGESRIAKEEAWADDDCRKYLRQFVYEARQALSHGLVTDTGTLEADGKRIETTRHLRKVTAAKREAEKKPTSAGRTTQGGTAPDLGAAAFERFCKAVEPFLPQLAEHNKLMDAAEFLSQKTGWEWSVYKK